MFYRNFFSHRIGCFPTACCLLLAASASATTLSDNLGATTNYSELIGGPNWITASFGTGLAPSTLASATLLLQSDSGGVLNLDLYSDRNRQPGLLLGTFAAPASYSSDAYTPTLFGGNGIGLSANTTYWLVASSSTGQFEWAYTDDNTGSGIGFQHTWGASSDAGQSWYTSTLQPMQMRVEDTPASAVPEPCAPALFLLGSVLMTCLLVRRSSHAQSH